MLTLVSATIAASGTTSAAVDIGGLTICGIELPAAFTGTTLTIHGASAPGGTFAVLRDAAGAALSITTAQGYRHYLDPIITAGWRHIKIVSGSTEAAQRVVTLLVRPV